MAYRRKSILERGIVGARQAGIPLILVDPQYYPGVSDAKNYAGFVDIVGDVGKERGIPVFSRYTLMKAWADESGGLLATMLSKDGLHMSDRGYACWAGLLADDIAGRIPTILATSKDPEVKGVMPVVAESTAGTSLSAQ